MKELYILSIDHGHALVTIKELRSASGELFYEGRMLETDGITIFDDSKNSCLKKLKNAIDTSLNFWLRHELSDLSILISK